LCFPDGYGEGMKDTDFENNPLLQLSNGCYIVIDNKGVVIFTTPFFDRFLGMATGLLIGKNIFEMMDENGSSQTHIYMGLQNAQRESRFDTELKHQQGDYRPVEVGIISIPRGDAGKAFILNIYDNRTSRDKEKQKLLFSRMSAEAPFPVFRINAAGDVLYLNNTAAALLSGKGWTQGDLVPEELMTAVTSALSERKRHRLFVGEGDAQCPLLAIPYSDEGEVLFFGVGPCLFGNDDDVVFEEQDMDGSKRNKFISNLVHELKNPLNGMMSMCELLQKSRLSDEQKKYTRTIFHSTAALEAMINDLMILSRSEEGYLHVESSPFNLKTLLEELILLNREKINEKGLKLIFEYQKDISCWFKGDEKKIRQIVMNLLINGIKFTEQGFIAIKVLSAEESPHHISVSIEDSGIGIPSSLHNDIFQRFFQAADGSYEGVGLGLNIVQELTELIGGILDVESEKGKGSRFCLTIPLETTDEIIEEEDKNGITHLDSLKKQHGEQILLVEDSLVMQSAGRAVLEKLGCRVDVANDGKHALEQLAVKTYSLVLMDCQMPVMDGPTAAKVFRELENPSFNKDVPIIALTAHAGKDELNNALTSGMTDYLIKPVSIDHMSEMLQRWLGKTHIQNVSFLSSVEEVVDSQEKNVPVFTPDEVLNRMDGDRQLLSELITIFLDGLDLQIMELKNAIHNKEQGKSERLSHSLKGGASNIGAQELRGYFYKMEILCRDGALDDALNVFAQMEGKLSVFRDTVENWH